MLVGCCPTWFPTFFHCNVKMLKTSHIKRFSIKIEQHHQTVARKVLKEKNSRKNIRPQTDNNIMQRSIYFLGEGGLPIKTKLL